MKTDLVLSPMGADVREMVDVARAADAAGFDAVWTYDHFSGAVAGKAWSRHPFVTLGAVAAVTERVGLGVLVANMVNRHPAQLASAVNTLQALAPGRVLCGLGAGAASGSPFAIEHEAIGRRLGDAEQRRVHLTETIHALRAIWDGADFHGRTVTVSGLTAVTDGTPPPPIIVGASSRATIGVAAEHADGVNIRFRPDVADRVALARRHAVRQPFEVSVFVALDPDHDLGGDPTPLVALGVDRRTLHVAAPFPIERIREVGARLAAADRTR